jgi:tetratricopeptide (TPR) repeat protein
LPAYRLDDLSFAEFEELCQSLLKARLGLGIEAWGKHGDWGRDAYFAGQLRFPRNELCNGPFVFQVKFVSAANAAGAKPRSAIQHAVAAECRRLQNRFSAGMEKPKCYCLITNAPLSGLTRKEIVKKLKQVLPANCEVITHGNTDIECWVNLHRELLDKFPQLEASVRQNKANRDNGIHNLPYLQNSKFVSREDDLTFIKTKFADTKTHSVVVLHGLGGVGKTQLAIEYAWRFANRYETRLWVRAEDCASYREKFASLAAVLNLPEKNQDNLEVRFASVVTWLRNNKDWLLICDAADTQPVASQLLRDLGEGFSGAIIITSRKGNWPLDFHCREIVAFQPGEALEFFQRRIGAIEFTVEDAMRVANALEFLPLALEQAAAYISTRRIGFENYLARLTAAKAQVLADDSAISISPTRYDKTIATTWRVTIRQLDSLSRAMLRLAAFLGKGIIPRFALAACDAVLPIAEEFVLREDEGIEKRDETNADTDAVERALAQLAEYSLITLSADGFELHELVRETERLSVPERRHGHWSDLGVCLLSTPVARCPAEFPRWSDWRRLRPHVAKVLEGARANGIRNIMVGLLGLEHGRFLNAQGEYREAVDLLRETVSVIEKENGPDGRGTARTLAELGTACDHLGLFDEGEAALRRALAILEKTDGSKSDGVASCMNNLGLLLMNADRVAEAEPLITRAFEMSQEVLKPNDPRLAASYTNMGLVLSKRGDVQGAIDMHSKAFLIAEAEMPTDYPERAIHLSNISLQLNDRGMHAEAVAVCNAALSIMRQTLPPHHPTIGLCLNNLGASFLYLKKFDQAESYFRGAEEILSRSLPANHPHLVAIRTHVSYFEERAARKTAHSASSKRKDF